ncbi:hypothetical protein ASPVEDRAFT_29835 [Aspergillus versicolor CBS 583.65]|uniref:Uncharacterized protein n=1 Tax=Aspergillus versicolor CBS 583.65 TaxID=1036611 RepID=A0A1L9PP82_ASPVE|nr:uncharacterized protein ASPVEDRAFT_29835 [Aspergillus versicolor CBS 583.65]OJJ03311.1 hypothetical protein ASPVEDRAFT_29835 [Aspergillus versicolor CBS 583.65]
MTPSTKKHGSNSTRNQAYYRNMATSLILQQVHHTSLEGLRTLSQVDQQWNRIAAPLLYRHIIIRLRKCQVPQRLLSLPDTTRVLAHVKQLSIVAECPLAGYRPLNRGLPKPDNYNNIRFALEDTHLGDRGIVQTGPWVQGDWALVTDFIQLLPPLHQVNILVSQGGPVELLRVIEEYHPTCRVSTFVGQGSKPAKAGLIEHWISSPLLHTVHITCFENATYQFHDHPDRAILRTILLASHVKQLALQISGCARSGPQPNFNNRIQLERETPSARAELEVLSWPRHTRMTAGQFRKWNTVVDYSCLRSWSVGCIEDSDLLWTIAHLRPFQQLKRLTLALYPPEDDPEFWSAAQAVFESLPPLTYLCLLGAYKPDFLVHIVGKHGATLSELRLHKGTVGSNTYGVLRLLRKGQLGPIFPSNTIQHLGHHCPSLQRLEICIQRRRGLETDVYTALAQFPHLTHLDLLLNCLPETGPNETPVPFRALTEYESTRTAGDSYNLPTWYIRDCLINCAIDEELAEAIFTHIRNNQEGGSRRLQRLTINPLYSQGGQYCPYNPYSDSGPSPPWGAWKPFNAEMFEELARPWTLVADIGEKTDIRAVSSVYQPGIKNKLRPDSENTRPQLLQIYNSIWPVQEDGQISI